MQVTIDLSEQDLERFRNALARARSSVRSVDESELVDSVRHTLERMSLDEKPAYIRERIDRVGRLLEMVEDEEFALPVAQREEILRVLVYFCDPEDLIPDDTPVVGMLDDAIMLELLLREERPLLEAYERFRECRASLGPKPEAYEARKAWLAALKKCRNLVFDW